MVPLDDVPNVIENYHICVVKMMKLDSHVIARAKQMKLVMQFGVGLEGLFHVAKLFYLRDFLGDLDYELIIGWF